MSVLNRRQKVMMVALIASSVLMFVSIFSLSYRWLGLGVLQFALVVFLGVYLNLKGRATVSDLVDYNFNTSEKHWQKKEFVRATVYGIATPMLIVGITVLCMMLFAAIFLF